MLSAFYNGFFNHQKPVADLLELFPVEKEQLLNRCERFAAGIYVYDNEWEMERTNRPVEMPLDQLNWDLNPFGDPEWTYVLNRHAFLPDIVLGYQLTQEGKYKEFLKTFILTFITENPLTEASIQTSWRSIDSGLRLVNWVKMLELARPLDIFTETEYQKIIASIDIHLNYLSRNLRDARSYSNWQVIELAGLLIGCLAFPQIAKVTEYQQRGEGFLSQALRLQVAEDGLQREQSFMYHHEVLICLLQIILIYKRNGRQLPVGVEACAVQMAQASGKIIRPDGMQTNFGDSDIESMVGLLQVAEEVLSEAFLVPKFQKQPTYYSTIFLGAYYQNKKEGRAIPSTFFGHSGLSILRDEKQTAYTLFKCGPLGGGHGHEDQLHMECFWKGESILADSGRYSYDENQERLDYKTAAAHNTVRINQQNFNQHSGAWGTSKVATPVNHRQKSKAGYHFCEGGHLGYMELASSVFINRKVLFLEEGIWFVFDEITTNGEHQIETAYHLPTTQIEVDERQIKARYGNSTMLFESLEGNQPMMLDWQPSYNYNEKSEGTKLLYKKEIAGRTVQGYVIFDQSLKVNISKEAVYTDQHPVKQEVSGLKIVFENGLEKWLIVQHFEPKYGKGDFKIGPHRGFGEVFMIEHDPIQMTTETIYII